MAWQCKECGELNDEAAHRYCWKCNRSRDGREKPMSQKSGSVQGTDLSHSASLCSTTMTIPGREILGTRGVVFGEAIMGANIGRDFLASFRDIVGGRSGTYESKLQQGREIAIQEMYEKATELGADAVIGVKVDYESLGQTMMLIICASGTAVTLKPEQN